jgi:hypothetical protein
MSKALTETCSDFTDEELAMISPSWNEQQMPARSVAQAGEP